MKHSPEKFARSGASRTSARLMIKRSSRARYTLNNALFVDIFVSD